MDEDHADERMSRRCIVFVITPTPPDTVLGGSWVVIRRL